jgi:DNA polymerase III delta subunit
MQSQDSPKLLIIHGENLVVSRNARIEALHQLEAKGFDVQVFSGEKITGQELELKLTTPNLFTQEALIIDNLLSRLKSAEKAKCIQIVQAHHAQKPLVLWEKRELTATMLKPFASEAQIKLYKESKSLFPFVDSLVPGNTKQALTLYHQALKDNDVMLIFGMLVRRLTDLLIAKSDPAELKGSPWGTRQIINQAKPWSEAELTAIYQKLLDIDIKTKTGATKIDLVSQLDLLILEL